MVFLYKVIMQTQISNFNDTKNNTTLLASLLQNNFQIIFDFNLNIFHKLIKRKKNFKGSLFESFLFDSLKYKKL